MNILISSHINYYKKTLPHLLESLAGVPREAISVVIGGAQTTKTYINEYNIREYFVEYNGFDYTALCWKADSIERENKNFFLMHDTCIAGPLFYEKICNVNNLTKLRPVDSMSMGVYPFDIIFKYKEHLQLYKLHDRDHDSIDKHKRLVCEHEDFIFKNENCQRCFGGIESIILNENVDYYNTGIKRRVEYYPQIDLTKIKGNYGQNGWTNFVVEV